MRPACALAIAYLAMLTNPVMVQATRTPAPRCTQGTWTIDGGPVTIGPFEIHTIAITDGVPFVTRFCRARRWALQRTGEVRVLFACRDPDGLRARLPLRLRALLSDACTHVDGAFAIRRMDAVARFTATRTGAPCTSDDDCTAEAFCQRPLGQCAAAGQCAPRPWECFGAFRPSCGCDGRNHTLCDAVSFADLDFCPCGGTTGLACSDGEFCDLPAGSCGSSDVEGRCVPIGGCSRSSPVCGCDGATYFNDCFRQSAGAQKAHDGACNDDCTSNDQCANGAYCAKPPGACGAQGQCTARPLGCPDNVDPVCGCDGATYFNACEAAAAGTNVARAGECTESCGGFTGIPCPDGQFCDLPAGQCGGADLEGRCVPTGGACPEIYSPVCGCDGKTYGNDCERRNAGVQLSQLGVCDCMPVCCNLGARPHDSDHDGCPDSCTNDACAGAGCPSWCETACDCYAKFGSSFCGECPLACPICGEHWECKNHFCQEACGVIPADTLACVLDTTR